MKKFLIIVGGILVFLAVALVAGCLYALHQAEKDKNRMKSDKARENRWKKKEDPAGSGKSDPPEDLFQEEEQIIDTPFTVVKETVKEKVA